MDSKNFTPVYNDFYVCTENKNYKAEGIVAIGFKNQGTSIITIQGGLILNPGDGMFTISMDKGFIDTTNYKIQFTPGGVNNLLIVTSNINVDC